MAPDIESGLLSDHRPLIAASSVKEPYMPSTSALDSADSPDTGYTRAAEPGERLLWSGRPRQGFVRRRGDGLFIAASLVWCSFAVFPQGVAITHGGSLITELNVGAFVAVGLFVLVGRDAADAYLRSRAFSGVADRRVLIVKGDSAPPPPRLRARSPDRDRSRRREGRAGHVALRTA